MPRYTLNCNGERREVDVDAATPLLWVLRDSLGLTGTKYGCGIGACGACTVHVDNTPTRSCLTPISTVGGKQVTTIEGLTRGDDLTRLQQAWVDEDVAQCGYCQAGQLMTATALLKQVARPSDAQIDSAMSGNICRCATYERIRKAIRRAAAATQPG